MLIIADRRMPDEAKHKLSRYGELIEFSTSGITYEAISGHPDIFFCRHSVDDAMSYRLIAAPNVPGKYLNILDDGSVEYLKGTKPVGIRYPDSALYNAVMTDGRIIHRVDISDETLLQQAVKRISVPQGYTRCSLLELIPDVFITSDMGIYNALYEHVKDILFVEPDNIRLPGFRHGFFGGTCGTWGDSIFFAGSLDYTSDPPAIRKFLQKYGYNIIELCDEPLFDCGSILFL